MNGTNINLSHKSLTANQLQHLAQQWDELKGFSQSNSGSESDNREYNVQLGFNSLGNAGAKVVATMIATYPRITSVDLCFNSIGKEGACSIARTIKNNSSLKELYLSGNHIGPQGFFCLAKSLETNRTLRSLNLTCGSGLAEGAYYLAEELKRNTTLTALCLNGNKIEANGMHHLSTLLTPSCNILQLRLGDNNITDSGLRYLSLSLPGYRKFQLIQLSFNEITRKGFELFVTNLVGYSSLKCFEIDNNRIGDDGLKMFVNVLPTLNISKLNVGFNKIGSEGVSALFRALTKKSSITYLDVSGSSLTPESTARISEMLKVDQLLSDLRLDSINVIPAGENNIAAGIAHNQNSSLLSFSGFNLGIALTRLGCPSDLAAVSNEKALEFLRASWAQRKAKMPSVIRTHSFGKGITGDEDNSNSTTETESTDQSLDKIAESGAAIITAFTQPSNTLKSRSNSLTAHNFIITNASPTASDQLQSARIGNGSSLTALRIPTSLEDLSESEETSKLESGSLQEGSSLRTPIHSLSAFNSASPTARASTGFAKLEKRISFRQDILRPPSLSIPGQITATPDVMIADPIDDNSGPLAGLLIKLRIIAQEPLLQSDYWQLYQYYFSPPDRVLSSPQMAEDSTAIDDDGIDEGVTSKRKSDSGWTDDMVGIADMNSIDEIDLVAASPAKRKTVNARGLLGIGIGKGLLGISSSSSTPRQQQSLPATPVDRDAVRELIESNVPVSMSSSAPKRNSATILSSSPLKRPTNNSTLAPITRYPRLLGVLETLKGDWQRTLVIFKQLRYLESKAPELNGFNIEAVLLDNL